MFGYEIYALENGYFGIVNGEGDQVNMFRTTAECKKWMWKNRTSNCWRPDGIWDWSREEMSK